jgi:hypothetical protein
MRVIVTILIMFALTTGLLAQTTIVPPSCKIYTIKAEPEKPKVTTPYINYEAQRKMQLAKDAIRYKKTGNTTEVSLFKAANTTTNSEEGQINTQSTGFIPSIGRNFVGNNFPVDRTPPDNSLAISNGGIIISADNYTIDYRNENGDTLKQRITYAQFFNDTILANAGFSDPHVLYDAYADRFIFVIQNGGDTTNSKVIIAFSKTNNPLDGWKYYIIRNWNVPAYDTWWFDYPSIAINKNELFITGNLFKAAPDGTLGVPESNILFQIDKKSAYDSVGLVFIVRDSIKDANNNLAFTIYPLNNGLMENSYDTVMYFVSTSYEQDNYVYWYKSTGKYNHSPILIKHKIATVAYNKTSIISQKGTPSNLGNNDCRITGGYFLDNKIHAVYNNGNYNMQTFWAQIVYERINVTNNTKARSTWGFAGNSHYAYPSICSYGKTSTDSSAMITFLRSGPTLYPEVCVVNFDNGFSASTKVVKQGNSYVDIYLNDPEERWGDYTAIQRKYNTTNFPVAWLVGCYGYGDSVNNYYGSLANKSNGYNAYIAEVGKLGVGLNKLKERQHILLYPNPTSSMLYLENNNIESVEITNTLGQTVKIINFVTSGIDVSSLRNGLYYCKLTVNENTYYEKFYKQ